MEQGSEVRKASAIAFSLLALAVLGVVFVFKLFGIHVHVLTNAFGSLRSAIDNVFSNFTLVFKLVKMGCKTLPGFDKFILILVLLIVLAIPVEFLAYLRRR